MRRWDNAEGSVVSGQLPRRQEVNTDHCPLATDNCFHFQMTRTNHSARPTLACEIAPDRVIAARASESGQVLELCSTSELAPGCVVPDLTENNLRERKSVVNALREALESVGGRAHDLVAVLPDAAVRVVLLDFEAPPTKPDEPERALRFRLRKSLRFESDKAKVSIT